MTMAPGGALIAPLFDMAANSAKTGKFQKMSAKKYFQKVGWDAIGADNPAYGGIIRNIGEAALHGNKKYLQQAAAAGVTGIETALNTYNPATMVLNPFLVAGDSYVWHPGTYLSDSTAAQPVVKPINGEEYWIQSTDRYGCHDTMFDNIRVFPNAVIYLGDSVTLSPGQTYQISPQTNCVAFSWSPPLGLSDTSISNPIASPAVSTKYIVKASTEWGCKTSDSINFHIDASSLVALPNAFTPGTSGINNYFKILTRGSVEINYFRVFNRWGNKVFETNNITTGWDGTFNGKDQPFDVYVYDVEAVTNEGVIFHTTGNVTLLR